ncbi:MAG TPA: PAS domain-containing protein [Candidatus Methylacidiphilales bacterium]
MTPAYMLTFLIFALIIAAVFYYAGIEPARAMKNWLAALANGERVPKVPPVGWRVWLHPLYREAEGTARKMDEIRAGSIEKQNQMRELEFIQNFVMSSLIEGILVVDQKSKVTLVNSEFLNIFQLEQSPLGQTVAEVLGDDKLDAIIRDVFETCQVQSGRVSKQVAASSVGGRPPSFEVSAIPVRISETRVESVVVIFLPPPDRTRMVQILKTHTERLHRLADSWTQHGGLLLRTSVADLSEIPEPQTSAEPTKEEAGNGSLTS